MNTPHVTICVPVYNAAHTIKKTLDSILSQDYENFSVLVSDNSSTDETPEILKSYIGKGIKCSLHKSTSDFPGEENYNYVMSLAEGPLITVYHADDLYTPTMVRRQVEFMQKYSHVTAVFTMSQMINEKNRLIRMDSLMLPKEYQGQDVFPFADLFNAALKYGTITVVPTMMARKTVLDRVGNFNWQQFSSAADIDLYFRMAQIGPIGIIDEPLHRYRISPQQGTNLINKSRTHLAHFFRVMDTWLSYPETQKITKLGARKIYELNRASDHVLCALNCIVLKQNNEAKMLLSKALKISHLVTAIKCHRISRPLLSGIILLCSINIGMSNLVGRYLYKAYQWKCQRGLIEIK